MTSAPRKAGPTLAAKHNYSSLSFRQIPTHRVDLQEYCRDSGLNWLISTTMRFGWADRGALTLGLRTKSTTQNRCTMDIDHENDRTYTDIDIAMLGLT
jgi:hypothetical protein